MKKTLFGFFPLLFITFCVSAANNEDNNPFQANHPNHYVVVTGDTIWGIAEKFLKNPWLWPEIWHVNSQITNPNLIYPNDIIQVNYIDGQPKLILKRTIKLSPKVHIETLKTAIPAIPLKNIRPFLKRFRVIDRNTINQAPYVISPYVGHFIAGNDDKVYARDRATTPLKLHSSYGVYRIGDTYIDPDTGAKLGIEALEVGIGKVIAKKADISTVILTEVKENIHINDRLLVTEGAKTFPKFFPSAPPKGTQGKIIAVPGGLTQIGQYNVVTINLGKANGIVAGNVMKIYHNNSPVMDSIKKELVQLPFEQSGTLIVFQVLEKVSYALILSAQRSLKIMDELKTP